jgi:hypothetical protein
LLVAAPAAHGIEAAAQQNVLLDVFPVDVKTAALTVSRLSNHPVFVPSS